jgi:hypothetical protein
MKTESKTPRTDAAHDPTSPEILYFEAKKMETELTAAQEHAERLRVALEKRDLGPVVIEWMRKYDEATKSEERDENCQIIRIPKRHIPKGATLIEAYETESQYIIIGQPADIEDENDPRFHNCDAMGCSSVSHVVLRADKALAAPSGQRFSRERISTVVNRLLCARNASGISANEIAGAILGDDFDHAPETVAEEGGE